MYTCFNLRLDKFEYLHELLGDDYKKIEYCQKGKEFLKTYKTEAQKNLKLYIMENGMGEDILSGKEMEKEWFPQIKTDIFLSHSHKDEDLAFALVGWLKIKCGVTAFMDSGVWEYADELLEILDKQYCRTSNSQTYDYKKRNVTTSHVHMMLNTALAKMIDKTECIFFLNTENSVNLQKAMNEKQTYSPWIYSEVSLSRIIRRKSREEHRAGEVTKSILEHAEYSQNMLISHEIKLDHMSPLSHYDLLNWANQIGGQTSGQSLDVLYRQCLNEK